jgi:3-oxoacyl-[acyl-carrier protein] reductase
MGSREAARKSNRSIDEVVAARMANNPSGRAGDPAEFGDACAFLCSAKVSYVVGQNLLLDGGAFNSSST